jgi:zinc protease
LTHDPSRPGITRTRLDNGLEVLVRPTESAVAAVYLWMESGSADERDGELGGAHFLEHMLFKGTGRRGVGAVASEIEGFGGDLNAFTTHEQTVLHATLDTTRWREALDVLVDMAHHATLDAEEFDREKLVILEEVRSYEDDPDTIVDETLQAMIYGDHGYGRPIAGRPHDVSALTVDALRGFWNREYAPNRTVLAVAGEVDPVEVQELANRLLSDWRSGPARSLRAPVVPPARAAEARVTRSDFASTVVELAWPTPGLEHPDLPALEVLAATLGQGASAALPARLQTEEGFASDAWAALNNRRFSSTFQVGFVPNDGDTLKALAAALDEVERVARGSGSGAAISRAREGLLADWLFAEETVDGLAYDLAWYATQYGDPSVRRAARDRLAAVTVDDVRRAAARWLTREDVRLAAVDPKTSARQYQHALDKYRHPKPGRAVAAPGFSAPARHGPLRFEGKTGARVLLLPDDRPVAAVRIVGVGGQLAESDKQAGLAQAWSRVLLTGAADRDAGRLGEAEDAIGGEIDATGGRNSLGISASFPASHLEDGLELLADIVLEPHFSDEEWGRIRTEMTEEIRTRPDRPSEIGGLHLAAELWKGHPWARPPGGTEQSLAKLNGKAMKRFHEHIAGNNLVVAVVGGFDPDVVAERLSWLDELPAKAPPLPARPALTRLQPGIHTLRAGREQAQVILGARGARFADPHAAALDIAAAVLGGQSGRLFLSLRERMGLAYSVWAQSIDGLDGGTFSAGLSTDPARVDEARLALLAELERFASAPPDASEIRRYVSMLVGQVAMGQQRCLDRAHALAAGEMWRRPWDVPGHRARFEAVTPDEVTHAMRAVLDAGFVQVVVLPEATPG